MYRLIRSNLVGALGALAAVWLGAAPELAAQTGTLAGRVTDAQSGQTIPAAQVFIADLDIGVLTQQNGSYLLLNVPAGVRTVTVQRIGYRSATQQVDVAAGETTVTDFRITEEALQLDEIIITGTPGGTQRRAIGNTVSQVDVGNITQDVAITNFQDMLSGRTPGLQFTRLSGNVGTGSPIKIRGVGSFNLDSNPLIYVDGVRVNNDTGAGPTIGSPGDGGGDVNVLDDFNPEDIESIEIIKGPAAASLYGTEASAGVIQIITKKGAEGAPQFNLSIRQGTNYMSNPAGRLGDMWTCPTDTAPGPGPTADCQTESELVRYNMYDEANRYIAEGYFPWPTRNLYQNGHTQSYNLDVRGGSQQVRYFLSANYEDEEGVVWYNTDETFRLRANVSVVFSESFTLDLSTGYVDGSTRFAAPTVSDGGVWQDMLWSNGRFLDRITPFNDPSADIRRGGFQEHLPSDVAEVEATRDYSRFTGSAQANFNYGGWLTSRAVVGIDKGWDSNRNFFPREDRNVPTNLTQYTSQWDPVYLPETVDGEMTYERPVTSNYSFDYGLTTNFDYADTWGFATSFGAQYYVEQVDFFANSGQGFASTLSRTINQLDPSRVSTDYSLIENKSLGFYVQEEIGWNDRIFLTAAVRFDDNSTFGVNAEAQKYPKFSGTWVVSEEGFWNFETISSLRLRGAWGKAGRQPSSLAGLNTYAAIPGPGGAPALRPDSPGNPAIEPEVSTELEVGFDLGLLNDRVAGEFTHYWRKDENALLDVAIPSSFGVPGSVDQNLGRIDNWGWEAQLRTRVYEGDAISFDLDLTADFTDNEIKDLGTYGGTSNRAIGLPYPNHNTPDWVVSAEFDPAGNLFSDFGTGITAMCDPGVSLAPDPNSPDAGKYGVVSGGTPTECLSVPNRNLYVGRAFATHTFSVAPRIGLLGNSLQIFALAEGQYGRIGIDNGHQWGHIYNNSKVARLQDDPVWVAEELLYVTGQFGWHNAYYDADFWKLREVGARYSLPQEWVQRTGAERASLAFSARNLWTIWVAQDEIYGHPVSDPEYGTPSLTGGGNYWETPGLTSLNMTLRVTF
jgi:TonB-linked SusC/RagA family outer membrane protein